MLEKIKRNKTWFRGKCPKCGGILFWDDEIKCLLCARVFTEAEIKWMIQVLI